MNLLPPALRYYLRKKAVHAYYVALSDILEFMQAHEGVNYRYFLTPSTELLPIYLYLNFGFSNTRLVIQRGQDDMQKVIEMGPGKSFDKVRNLTKRAEQLLNESDPRYTKVKI